MEIPDIHLRVLFDFDYTTKDGKEVKIKEGEKLYLIKKTNEDWWQVIRSAGRPFYVPASYVEEISRIPSKGDKKLDGNVFKENNYRMRSCSVESQGTHESHKIKPAIPKRTIFDAKKILEIREANRSQVPDDEPENEVGDYVNVSKESTDSCTHSTTPEGNPNFGLDKSAALSATSNDDKTVISVSNFVTDDDDGFTNGYSHVNVRTCSLSPVNNLQMNLSNSLEELTQEIELKAKSIGGGDAKSNYSKIDNIVKSISKDIPVSAKNLNDSGNSALKQVNNYESQKQNKVENEAKSKLQYSGSFKTKHEREKWAKNYVLLSSMKEEEISLESSVAVEENEPADSEARPAISKSPNDGNNNVNSKHVTKANLDNINNNFNPKVNSIGGPPNEEEVSVLKGDSYEEKVPNAGTNQVSSSNVPENNSGKFTQLRNYFNSSTEDLDKNSVYINTLNLSHLTPSDKGSTDSLLDVDNHLSIQEESICTTASDSLLHTSDTSEECLNSILREENSLSEQQQKKKAALKRNSRVESCRLRFPVRGGSPPVPEENQQPTKDLFGGWCEYTFTDGRIFFYNSRTGEKSWKPPRRRCNTDDKSSKHSGSTGNIYSDSSSPLAEIDENSLENSFERENCFNVAPNGWRLDIDREKGCQCFINIYNGAKWYYSNDEEGRVYYFEENSSESSWTLPIASNTSSNEKSEEHLHSLQEDHVYSNLGVITRSSIMPGEDTVTGSDGGSRGRALKTRSMILMETKNDEPSASLTSKIWPQLFDGRMCIIKEGVLNRTKITENGKRLRKNWSSSYVALTELFLLFFKDAKSFAATKNGGARPEINIDLNGALIDKADKVSSRKNVYIISTVLGLQVLIQNDCAQQAEQWLTEIQKVIKNLPSGFDSCPRLARGPVVEDAVPDNESKKFYKVTRSKSVKGVVTTLKKQIAFDTKNKDGSVEDLAVAERTKIKARLKKFFHRRPTVESLIKKGIYKDEPAFGSYLEQVAGNLTPKVPEFVKRCINCIEKNEENMKTDGLYRASGNLSQVQKIRLQVDQNKLDVVEEEEDVHVLTGALKLFFRELKEPLIPYQLFKKAIDAGHNHNRKEKISQFREIVKALPAANYDTLRFLLQHLLKVTKYKDFNRMHIPNLAIVFGPTLMWSDQESSNMAFDLMQQNIVIECLLVEYDNIFR